MKLLVSKLSSNEIYRDLVRIPEEYRLDRRSRPVEEGRVCSLFCADTGNEVFVVVRGSNRSEPIIGLDERTRNKLGVQSGKNYEFELKRSDFCGEVRWALESSDVRYSFASRVALVSLCMGLLSIVLAVVALVIARR